MPTCLCCVAIYGHTMNRSCGWWWEDNLEPSPVLSLGLKHRTLYTHTT